MANSDYLFESRIHLGQKLPEFTQDEIKYEPMFFSSSAEHSLYNGGPITLAFLRAISPDILCRPDFIFDSRVHLSH